MFGPFLLISKTEPLPALLSALLQGFYILCVPLFRRFQYLWDATRQAGIENVLLYRICQHISTPLPIRPLLALG